MKKGVSIYLLLISAFIIAASGLAFEIIAGTMASYLLGNSATQFSLSIGVYMFALGIGSYLSRYIKENLIEKFIDIEIITSLVGGLSALIFFLTFSMTTHFGLILWLSLTLIGTMVGLEIPILLRILKDKLEFKDLLSRVLSLDYIGGLVAAIILPLILIPKIGLIRSSIMFGLLNLFVSACVIFLFRHQIRVRIYILKSFIVLSLLTAAFVGSNLLIRFAESALYADRIIYSKQSRYQRIILTKWNDQFSLFLNNNLQFNSKDEYRYHEALVHPVVKLAIKENLNALVLGGGDGLAIRELLKYKEIQKVTLVELDPEMIRLAHDNYWLKQLNQSSLSDKRVHIITQDAFNFIREDDSLYDIVIIDFPDPSNFSIGKLYSQNFYTRLRARLSKDGVAITQATSPMFARKSFWCINKTIEESGFYSLPMHTYVPSFGEWGFIIFAKRKLSIPKSISARNLKFLNSTTLRSLFEFPDDMSKVPVKTQKLNSQLLVSYYTQEWNSVVK